MFKVLCFTALKLFSSLLMLFSSVSYASPNTCCVCQIGTTPTWQKGFFKKGCDVWLKEQTNCQIQEIQEQPDPFLGSRSLDLPVQCIGGTLQLGYVGHWRDTRQTVDYFRTILVPTMLKNRVHINYDNTACEALKDPAVFKFMYDQERMSGGLSANSRWGQHFQVNPLDYQINIRANQVKSIGMWDRMGGDSTVNFPVFFDGKKSKMIYPACEKFEGKSCYSSVQSKDSGTCQASNGQMKHLYCCTESSSDESGNSRSSQSVWTDRRGCQ